MANVFGTNASETLNALDGVTNGADTIFGFGGNDDIFALGGNDLILGGAGADDINGGSGSDTSSYTDSAVGVTVSLESGTGSGGTAQGDTLTSIENLTGSAHGDFLVGNGGANVLTGLEGSDTLKGGGGADTLYGDSGNDVLKGGGGADTLNGGSGVDTANYAESGAGVFVSLITDTASGGDAEGDELNSIENLAGSTHNDNLWGNDGVNVLSGNDGNDTLKGYGGADTLNGGDGNDTLIGGTGADTMNGGSGNDTYWVDNAADVVNDTAGFEIVYTSTSYTLGAGASVELFKTTDDDGTDAIGLTGNGFSQEIMGNDGANSINGAGGNDILWGNGGDDAFIFDSALGAGNIDVIADYSLSDLIALDNDIFTGLGQTGDGHLAAANFVVGAAATNASQKIIYNSATGALYYDADGNGAGAAVQFANVGAGLALNSDEFILIG
jgi:Ca2+-binding RTX toxin-like protein